VFTRLNGILILDGERFNDNDFHPNHPDITEEMWGRIDGIICQNKGVSGSVIGVLRECQDVVGYLPVELIDYISNGLICPAVKCSAWYLFMRWFSLQPKGRNLVKVCMGTACYVKGIKEVITRIENHFQLKQGNTSSDRRFSLEAVRCLGACGLAPVMVVNRDTYGDVKAEQDRPDPRSLRVANLPGFLHYEDIRDP